MTRTSQGRLAGAMLAALLAATACSSQPPAVGDDPLWLEDPHGAQALSWAREATERSRQSLSVLPSHAGIDKQLQSLLQQAPTEPDTYLLGPRALRMFRDARHPYGLLQTANRGADGLPGEWRTVLDVAALREREGIPFELQSYALGSHCLAPAYARCLLSLSPAGGDEVEIREFDLDAAGFVDDGFRVGKSRAFAEWLGPDRILVMHAMDGQPKTLAGWPAAVRIWQRGQALDDAVIGYQGAAEDAILQMTTVGVGDDTLGVVTRAIDYTTFEVHLVDPDGNSRKLPFPREIKSFGVQATSARHVIVQLAREAVVEGKTYPAETILAYDASAGTAEAARISVVYTPSEGEFVDPGMDGLGDRLVANANAVALVVERNLEQRVVVVEHHDGGWQPRDLFKPAPGDTVVLRADERNSNDFTAAVSGFITPRSQYLIRADGARQLVAQDPTLIDASGFVSELGSATSRDGTRIDYFMLRPATPPAGGQALLMTGYGAFGMSFRPGYFDWSTGGPAMRLWFERGGALVIPAIRGGGERGSDWHTSVIRENRQTSYDDFIAVAEHLVSSGFTQPERIGVFGMSNGGLLTATLGTQRPDLFGAVVSDVPLTDLIRMRHMGMGAAWMNEYGDPDIPAQAAAMEAYSPFQNVRTGVAYPPFLVTISTEDNRVGPGHARKFAYRLEEAGATVHFYEDEEGGHGVSDALRNPELMALRMSFLIDHLMPDTTRQQ